jgi:hypothetical protein
MLNMGPSHPRCTAPCASCSSSRARPSRRRRADRLPAPRLREDVRARHVDQVFPYVDRSTTSRRCSTTWATRSRWRSCSASPCRSAAVVPRDPRRARAHLGPPHVQRRHGDGARRVHAVPLVDHQGPRDDLGHPRGGDRRAPHAQLRPRRRHGEAADPFFKEHGSETLARRPEARRDGEKLLLKNRIFLDRLENVGVDLRADDAIALGWTGPTCAPRGGVLRRAQGAPVPRLRRGRVRRAGRHDGRQLRSLHGARRGDPSVDPHHRAGARADARRRPDQRRRPAHRAARRRTTSTRRSKAPSSTSRS